METNDINTDESSGDCNVKCPNCGNEYVRIGHHWSMSQSCSRPPLSDCQIEIIEGMLLGDGYLNDPGSSRHNRFGTSMINRPFLEALQKSLKPFSKNVSLKMTAEDNAARHAEDGFNPTAKAENYHDLYLLSTTTHPTFDEIRRRWYDTGGTKHFPDDIDLTPTIAKYWYVGDGGLYWDSRDESYSPHAQFGISNESHRPDFLVGLFRSAGFSATVSDYVVHLTAESTKRFLDWMGDPLTGFEYKWANESYERYRRLIDKSYGVLGNEDGNSDGVAR